MPKGATAFGVRLLDRFVADHYEEDIASIWPRSASTICCRRRSSAPCRSCWSGRARRAIDRRPGRLGRARGAARRAAVDLRRGELSAARLGPRRQCRAQPIWLDRPDENPNGATMLVLVDGVEAGDLSSFARCADLFDGNDAAAVEAARERWRRAREAGPRADLLAADRAGMGTPRVDGPPARVAPRLEISASIARLPKTPRAEVG